MDRTEVSRNKLMSSILEEIRETGYKKSTTKKIALRAGMNEASIFRLFKSKEALFLSAVLNKTISIEEIDMDSINSLKTFKLRVESFIEKSLYLYIRQMPIYRIFMLSIVKSADADYQLMVFSRVQKIILSFSDFLKGEFEAGEIRNTDFTLLSEMIFSKILILALEITGQGFDKDEISNSVKFFAQNYSYLICDILQK